MKSIVLAGAGCAGLLFAASGSAGGDWHHAPQLLQADGSPVDTGEFDPGGHAAPFLADVDGDGRRDLVVGSFVGKFRFFRNTGADAQPRFGADSRWLQADGRDAQVPNFCCVPVGVQVVDLDGDGIPDLSSGSYYPGQVYWFRGLGGGDFGPRQALAGTDGLPLGLRIGPKGAVESYKANIAWTRWNDDEHMDVIIGDSRGLYLRKGQKGRLAYAPLPSLPVFGPQQAILLEGANAVPPGEWRGAGTVRPVEYSAAPAVADWDGDGLWDLILGVEDGSVWWLRNSGRPGAPEFKSREQLVGPGVTFQWQDAAHPPRRGRRAHVQAVDFNGDGRLDLLVGDWTMVMMPRPDLTARERRTMTVILEKLAALDKEVNFQFDNQRAGSYSYSPAWGARAGAREEAMELERSLSPYLVHFTVDGHTTIAPSRGKVWLYLRKAGAT